MILVDFDRDSMREPSEQQIEKLGSVAEWQLRYSYFEAQVTLAADGFETESFRVPVLDFMYCLLLSAQAVREGGEGRVSFTESDMLIEFVPQGTQLKILRSWNPVAGFCGTGEFFAAVSRFADDCLGFIVDRYPAFRDNPTHQKLVGFRSEMA
ncbi:hypothetical protein EDD98_1154 [Streptomyces sp. PanSC19]|uniref:hypothetical protein n=1 Tax=Streptomyces sp. PanSC19 TaxID=1520455 RepID=UPI000F481AA0|nr:hypothetical protein [Streptomyces sp. PanSC19]ROQ32180.1 hypothetical protein EDD98_1154 [Streptomyces sp. PanSC19]